MASEFAAMEGDGGGPRKRYVEGYTNVDEDEGVYGELERLRSIVDVMEGDRKKQSTCFKLSLNNGSMSTIFGVVFVVVMTVTIYAFVSLFRAVSKRFFPIE